MKFDRIIKAIPTASPVGEILKIATFLTATLLVKRLEKMLQETPRPNIPTFETHTEKEE